MMLPIVLLMASCASTHKPSTPEDTTLHQNARAAGAAFTLDRPEEAVTQYKRALERARARDDAAALGDYGYDLAVAQLAANHPDQALASVRLTRDELARRGVASFPELDLAEATALYRLGAKQESRGIAVRVAAGDDPTAAARARYLEGLIADETGDAAGLDAAIASLARPASADQQADMDELLARRDLGRSDFNAAIAEAARSADLRRTGLDYRGMARALSVAADAEAHAGNAQAAAELYMRAGQSAGAQGDADMARTWLQRAAELAIDPVDREAARHAIAALGKPAPSPDDR
jgi:hypothetical protein